MGDRISPFVLKKQSSIIYRGSSLADPLPNPPALRASASPLGVSPAETSDFKFRLKSASDISTVLQLKPMSGRKTNIMKIPKPREIAIFIISFAGVALLSFIGGTKFSDSRPSMKGVAPASTSNNTLEDSDIITELRHDGTRILWIKAADGRILNQYKFDSDGTLALRTTYRIDASGSPVGCKVFDGHKTEIFKVSYGYRKSDGMLAEERVFDSRLKRLNDQGREMPVRRIVHVADADNSESKREMIELVSIDFPQELEGGFRNPFQQK